MRARAPRIAIGTHSRRDDPNALDLEGLRSIRRRLKDSR